MIDVQPTPATRRLEWVLAGLDGADGWGTDAAEVLAPDFAALVPPATFVDVYRRRAERFAPVTVVLLEAGAHYARAHVDDGAGGISVVHCHVEEAAPHRITRTWMAGFVPENLTPRLPLAFAAGDLPDYCGRARLMVMTGVPGSGKSTVAEAVGRAVGAPVFALDWLLGALTPFGGHHFDRSGEIGAELLTTLAYRQLCAGQSAILDAPAEDATIRERWIGLARAAGARLRVVQCVCSDERLHRSRVEERKRNVAGWYDAGDWEDVVNRLAAFTPWPAETLVVDTSRPLADCVAEVVGFVGEVASLTAPTDPAEN